MTSENPFLVMVRMTPYRLVRMLSWDSERSASSNFALRKKSAYEKPGEQDGVGIVLTPSPPFEVLN
jgi:hypothetical protein